MSANRETSLESQPSWWKYVAGEDADTKWAEFYVSTVRHGGEVSERDLEFYLGAISRAVQPQAKAASRPPHVLNFWLVCYYLLGTTPEKSRKAAALDTADLAKRVKRSAGHSYKQIQRYATKLEAPAAEFLATIIDELPIDWSRSDTGGRVRGALVAFIERRVREVA